MSPMPSRFAEAGARAALVAAIDARLATMRAVAAAKWISGAPIEDPAREAEVLAAVTTQALVLGLETAPVQRWFIEQMAAAREVQQHWHATWRRKGMCGECRRAADLAALRRRIDESNRAQLLALCLVAPGPDSAGPPAGETPGDDLVAYLLRLGRRHGLVEATVGRLTVAYRDLRRVAARGPTATLPVRDPDECLPDPEPEPLLAMDAWLESARAADEPGCGTKYECDRIPALQDDAAD
jgi:chorismate mutase